MLRRNPSLTRRRTGRPAAARRARATAGPTPRDSGHERIDRPGRIGGIGGADLAAALLTISAVALWWISSAALPLRRMNDLGLASVLPPAMWAALLLITAAFLAALRSGRRLTVVATLVATVVLLHGLGVVTEPEMRFSVSWRHIGIADYIATRGTLDPTLDAYQSWPAFFALSAFLRDITGIDDPASVLTWTPVLSNLLYLLPVVAIGERLLGRGTTVWVGTWIFTISNWIGQDYYSPQGWYLFIYLVVIALVLTFFMDPFATGRPSPARHVVTFLSRYRRRGAPVVVPPPDEPASALQRSLLLAVILLMTGAMISGHQLSPFALLLALTALGALGWSRLQVLPVLLMLGVLLWLGSGASAYIDGHGEELRSQVGAITSIFSQTVGDRLTGSPGHSQIVRLRLVITAVLWLLALVGALRLVRSGRVAISAGLAVAAGSTFPLLAMQSYGGEALLRIALFSSPFMALLAASAITGPLTAPPGPRVLTAAALVGALFVLVFPFTRYGNERMDWYSPQEVGTVEQMYATAPPGSVLTSITGNLPWRYTGYADYDHRILVDGTTEVTGPDAGLNGSVDVGAAPALLARQIASRMQHDPGQRSYLILTRNQGGELELLNGEPPGAFERIAAVLLRSPIFRTVESTEDSVLVELVGATS